MVRWFEQTLQRFVQFGLDLAALLIRRILGLPRQAADKARKDEPPP